MTKYVKRHRLGVAAAAVILILALAWLVSALWQRNVAREQAARNLRLAYAADMNLGMQAYERANLNRLNEIIARYRNTGFTNNWEYRFLQSLAKPRAQLLMIPHPNEVWDVMFSSDSKRMATACADGFARIYQVPEGKLLATTATKEANIWRLRFSPDDRFLATASGDLASTSVKVWNAETGAETLSLVGHTARVRGLDISPDGKMIATGSRDETIRIWDAVNGRELKRFAVEMIGEPGEIQDLHFTPDGHKLIVASKKTCRVWDLAAGRILFKSAEGKGGAWSVAVSPDGKRFALGGYESRVQIFDANPARQGLEIARHEARINNLAFSPDGSTIASASSDRTIRFSDAQTGAESQNLKVHLSEAWSVAFSRDGKYVATSGTDFNVFLFDAPKLLKGSSFGPPLSYGGAWSAISLDRSKVVVPSMNTLAFWDIKSRHEVAEFFTKEPLESGSFSPDGTILATGGLTGMITLWNSATGAEIRHFRDQEKYIRRVVFSPDGKRLISASDDKTVRIWNIENPVGFLELCRFDKEVTALGVSPDGRRVFVASLDPTAKLIDFDTRKVIAEIGISAKPFLSVAFAPGGQTFAIGDADGAIQIRQTVDGKLVATFIGSTGQLTALTYSPDGSRLASASAEGVIRLWDTKTGDQVLAIYTGAPNTSFLAFTPDGNTLISHGTVGRIQLWEAGPR